MPEDRIQRKELWAQLGSIKENNWLKVAEKLELLVTTSKGGTSHTVIRLPSIPVEDPRGIIATIYAHMSKQVQGKVFKRFLDFGFSEDDIWKGLGKL
jgi:hypothetical protein